MQSLGYVQSLNNEVDKTYFFKIKGHYSFKTIVHLYWFRIYIFYHHYITSDEQESQSTSFNWCAKYKIMKKKLNLEIVAPSPLTNILASYLNVNSINTPSATTLTTDSCSIFQVWLEIQILTLLVSISYTLISLPIFQTSFHLFLGGFSFLIGIR